MGISHVPNLLDKVEDSGDRKKRGIFRLQRQSEGSRKVSRKVEKGQQQSLEGLGGFTSVKRREDISPGIESSKRVEPVNR